MLKNSSVWKVFYKAWDLACDRPLPVFARPVSDNSNSADAFNALYALPVWGAAGGIAALLLGAILNWLLPVNGAALVFAILLMIASEMRTSGRGAALNITFFEQLFSGKNFVEARYLRRDTLKNSNGIFALLLAVIVLGGKFMLICQTAKTGHFGAAGAAWVVALSTEAVLAAEPSAKNVPAFCHGAHSEYIVALAGFFLLFNLIALPIATLIAAGASAAAAIIMLNLSLRHIGTVDSNDMTMTGYMQELLVWFCMAVLVA